MSYESLLPYESVDDLVECLNYTRYVARMNKSIFGSNKSSSNNLLSLSYSKTIMNTFNHLNQKMMLGIVSLGPNYTSENDIANILYDLKTFPKDMVIERLKNEGAIIAPVS
jgi:hypothetical protein